MSIADTTIIHALQRMFPVPSLWVPPVAGIDISDSSIKWIVLARVRGQIEVSSHGEVAVPSGIIELGVIKDEDGLEQVLIKMRASMGFVRYAHVSLPEESAYVFSMRIPHNSTPEQTKTMIEFEFENRVPLPLSDAVYDFDTVTTHGGETEIVITAFPRVLGAKYAQILNHTGITPLSFENELLSAASVLVTDHDAGVGTLIVDCGASHTGVACVRGRVPIYTATIPIGTKDMIAAITSISGGDHEAAEYLDTVGVGGVKDYTHSTLFSIADMLSTEIMRYYRLWNIDRTTHEPLIQRGIIVGGGANVYGLPEYLSQRVKIPIEQGNVWGRCLPSFDTYIPPIEHAESLEYATAIGLALRAISV